MPHDSPRLVNAEPRKFPRQQRAIHTCEAIIEAAAHILVERGSSGFTTNHVAARAGVSIGTLYQYYPNKSALLLELQRREMKSTWSGIESVISATSTNPQRDFRSAVRAFFASEAEEAELRAAIRRLGIARPEEDFKGNIRSRANQVLSRWLISAFGLAPRQARHWAEVVIVTVSSVAESVTARELTSREIRRWADLVSTMLLSQIQSQNKSS